MTKAQQLAKINEAMAQGVTEVSFNGKKVVYRSLAEMRSIREELERSVSGNCGPDVLKPCFSKGY